MQTVEALWGPFWPLRPSVQPEALDATSPMDIPFNITNNSLFNYTDLSITCNIEDLKDVNQSEARHININVGNDLGDLDSGQSRPYTCPFSRMVNLGGPVIADQIAFMIRYKRNWWFFTPEQQTFRTGSFALNTMTRPYSWQSGLPLN